MLLFVAVLYATTAFEASLNSFGYLVKRPFEQVSAAAEPATIEFIPDLKVSALQRKSDLKMLQS